MKVLFCGACFDIRALETTWTTCKCGNMWARWVDPERGTVVVHASNRSKARIIGLNNRMLEATFNFPELRHEEWAKLHDAATNAKGFVFDKALRACWACVLQVGETNDIRWDDDPPKELPK